MCAFLQRNVIAIFGGGGLAPLSADGFKMNALNKYFTASSIRSKGLLSVIEGTLNKQTQASVHYGQPALCNILISQIRQM